MDKTYKLNDQVVMKKQHACGTNLFKITRVGVDIKIKCVNKKLKKVLGDSDVK